MKKSKSSLPILTILTVISCFGISGCKTPTETSVTRIGVYDSRSIAVAFIGSEIYQNSSIGKQHAALQAELMKAKAEGDDERFEKLCKQAEPQTTLLHQQGFSTAPVDDILEHITDRLPEIMKQAEVDRLISKWDTKTLAKHESSEREDVTILLIEAFKPNERQKAIAIGIQNHEPLPLEKMKGPGYTE